MLQANKESRFEAQKVPEWAFHTLATYNLLGKEKLLRFMRKDFDIAYIRSVEKLHEEDKPNVLIALKAFKTFRTLALSLDVWRYVKDELRSAERGGFGPKLFWTPCQELIVAIRDAEFEWDSIWVRRGMDSLEDCTWKKVRYDNYKPVFRETGRFQKVLNNTQFAEMLGDQFERLRKEIIGSGKGKARPLYNEAFRNMEMKVLSE